MSSTEEQVYTGTWRPEVVQPHHFANCENPACKRVINGGETHWIHNETGEQLCGECYQALSTEDEE